MRGLVLEGGGAKGAYHVGVYKALREDGIEFDGITGTSIGSINGAIFIQEDWQKAQEVWESISYSVIFGIKSELIQDILRRNLTTETFQNLAKEIRRVFNKRGIDIKPIMELL